ncbi:MAG: glycosyltransferase family 2 protein, partial [Abditibacteriaceae bacterium]
FHDERIAAVAGNVKVGNRDNVLTRWQAIEYITSQNLDRRAYGLLNAITVVPGAIGAWRLSAVRAVGGYVTDTLAEDMDLTWRLRCADWTIVNETGAIAFTEAPDTLGALFKQRFRWAYGTLQCLMKHRRALGRNGVFGKVMLPLVWIFQFLLQWLAPLVDLQLLIAALSTLYTWYWNGTAHGQWMPDPTTLQFLQKTGYFYALFFATELASAFYAVKLDKEDKSLLWWLFWQRVVYRQMLYCVIWKATWMALTGMRQGWNKMARKGSVKIPFPTGD